MIYVYRPMMQSPQVDLTMNLKSEVGGFLGMGTSVCNSQIFFDKNQYYLGEEAKVRIVCDNSACEKDIKSFKFKLLRVHKGHENGPYSTMHSEYLKTQKAAGLAKNEKCDRTFTMQIPT